MPTKVIQYRDATVTVHVAIFGNSTVDVVCRTYKALGLTVEQFAALVYPSIDEKAPGPTLYVGEK